MEGRGAAQSLRLAALFLLIQRQRGGGNPRTVCGGGGGRLELLFPLLIVSSRSSNHCTIHNCSTPFLPPGARTPLRTGPELRAAVPPLQSAVLPGTGGKWA